MSRINEIGSDFVCVGQSYIINGGSLCFPFSAVDEIDIGPYADNR